MEVFGIILFVIGIIIYLIGSVQFIIAECRESVWWFIGSFFIPILPFIFLCVHFHEAWPSTKKILLGFLLIVIAGVLCSKKDMFGDRKLVRTSVPLTCLSCFAECSRG